MNVLNDLPSTCLRAVVTFALRAGLSVSLVLSSHPGKAQNLVPNWSFEDTAYCTTADNPILVAPPWFSANYATPDIYNMDDSPCGVYMDPNQTIGAICFQAPYHGNRFAGEYLWQTTTELKEYMQVSLTESLVAGRMYRVAMEISLPDCWKRAVNTLGAHFSMDTIFDPTLPIPGVLPFVPQAVFHEPAFYTDETNWMHVEDTIVANGGERFMLIGSFTDNASTATLQVPGNTPFPHAYYYFDAIVVEEVGEPAVVEDAFVVWSGPGWLSVRTESLPTLDRLVIWDLRGRCVLETGVRQQGSTISLDTHSLAQGTYVVEVIGGGWRATAKWTKVE
ncbi:MAG: T9SS type A sorting domain-containing protein [Flavobacteriales bacterium]|nr:T9SS type A sorting domain-containing protein [Flavobacteriales bacterium]